MIQQNPLQQEDFDNLTASIRPEDQSFECERFRVFARDIEAGSYFVGKIKPSATEPEDFYWCNTNQRLSIGNLVDGYLSESSDLKKLPLLVIK